MLAIVVVAGRPTHRAVCAGDVKDLRVFRELANLLPGPTEGAGGEEGGKELLPHEKICWAQGTRGIAIPGRLGRDGQIVTRINILHFPVQGYCRAKLEPPGLFDPTEIANMVIVLTNDIATLAGEVVREQRADGPAGPKAPLGARTVLAELIVVMLAAVTSLFPLTYLGPALAISKRHGTLPVAWSARVTAATFSNEPIGPGTERAIENTLPGADFFVVLKQGKLFFAKIILVKKELDDVLVGMVDVSHHVDAGTVSGVIKGITMIKPCALLEGNIEKLIAFVAQANRIGPFIAILPDLTDFLLADTGLKRWRFGTGTVTVSLGSGVRGMFANAEVTQMAAFRWTALALKVVGLGKDVGVEVSLGAGRGTSFGGMIACVTGTTNRRAFPETADAAFRLRKEAAFAVGKTEALDGHDLKDGGRRRLSPAVVEMRKTAFPVKTLAVLANNSHVGAACKQRSLGRAAIGAKHASLDGPQTLALVVTTTRECSVGTQLRSHDRVNPVFVIKMVMKAQLPCREAREQIAVLEDAEGPQGDGGAEMVLVLQTDEWPVLIPWLTVRGRRSGKRQGMRGANEALVHDVVVGVSNCSTMVIERGPMHAEEPKATGKREIDEAGLRRIANTVRALAELSSGAAAGLGVASGEALAMAIRFCLPNHLLSLSKVISRQRGVATILNNLMALLERLGPKMRVTGVRQELKRVHANPTSGNTCAGPAGGRWSNRRHIPIIQDVGRDRVHLRRRVRPPTGTRSPGHRKRALGTPLDGHNAEENALSFRVRLPGVGVCRVPEPLECVLGGVLLREPLVEPTSPRKRGQIIIGIEDTEVSIIEGIVAGVDKSVDVLIRLLHVTGRRGITAKSALRVGNRCPKPPKQCCPPRLGTSSQFLLVTVKLLIQEALGNAGKALSVSASTAGERPGRTGLGTGLTGLANAGAAGTTDARICLSSRVGDVRSIGPT